MKCLAVLLAGFALSSATLKAQSSSGVPDSHRPPPGMCRIWIDGVPPTHQPAPTDCATAIRKRPTNARVVFGSDAPAGSQQRNFAPQPGQTNFAQPVAPSHADQDRIAQQQRDEQERQRLQQQRDAQERQRIEAQRQHEEAEKRAADHAPPPPTQHNSEHAAPTHQRPDKPRRPPHQSFSAHRSR